MPTLDEILDAKIAEGVQGKKRTPLDDILDSKIAEGQAKSEEPSSVGSFLRSALREAPSAAVAGTVGRVAQAGATPFMSPLGAAAVSIPLAGASAYFTRKYQDPALKFLLPTEAYNRYATQEQSDINVNPRSSALGGFASQLASGYIPRPDKVISALGTGGKLIRNLGSSIKSPIAEKEIANLINVGQGGVIAPAMLAGQNAVTGQSSDLNDYLQSIGAGLLFNQDIINRVPRVASPPPLPRPPLRLPLNTESGLAELNRPGNIELTPEQLVQRANQRLQPKSDAERIAAEQAAKEVPALREVLSKRPSYTPDILPTPDVGIRPNISNKAVNIVPLEGRERPPQPIYSAQEIAAQKAGVQYPLPGEGISKLDQIIKTKIEEGLQNAPKTSSIEAGISEQPKGANELIQNEGINRNITSPVETESTKAGASDILQRQAKESVVEETLPTAIQAALKRIKEKSGGQSLAGIPDPTIIADLARVGSYYVGKGINKANEWTTKMREKFGSDIDPHILNTVWQDVKDTVPERNYKEYTLGPHKPQIEKVKSLNPSGKYLGERFEKFYDERDKLQGLSEGFAQEAARYKSTERQNVERYLQDQLDTKGKSKIALTPREMALAGEFRKWYQSPEYLKSGIREIDINEHGYPQATSPDVLNILINHPEDKLASKLKNDFIQYQIGQGNKPKEAENMFSKFIGSFKNPETVNRASQYGPLDKPEGYGIPLSWRQRDLIKNVTSYGSRAARRISYFHNLETDPISREILKMPSEDKSAMPISKLPSGEDLLHLGSHDIVTPVLKDIEGRYSPRQANIAAAQRFVRSGMMGTMTGTYNLIGSQVQGWQHMTPKQILPSLVAGWKDINKNLIESTKAGKNRVNHSSLEFLDSEYADPVKHLNDISNISNKIQGKNLLERISRATNWGQGKWLAMSEFNKGKSRLLDEWIGKGWQEKSTLTPEDLNRFASKYVDSVQGTYDPRGLPSFYNEAPYSALLALSRWSGEKTNNYMKYVVTPLLNGNPRPFLMQTAGMIVGGAAIEKIIEAITGRKSSAPNYRELAAGMTDKDVSKSDEAVAIGYKAMSLATLAGTAGILSNLAKSSMDILHGNRPQSIGDPLWEMAERTGITLTQAIQAFVEGESNVGINLMVQLFKDNIQASRMILSQIPEKYYGLKDSIERGNKSRDLKVYEKMHGHRANTDLGIGANPFMNKEVKSFRNSKDSDEIIDAGKNLYNKALDKNPKRLDLFMGDVNRLKTPGKNVMPSFENNPTEFMKYYNWIYKTQGEKAALKLYNEYLEKTKGYDVIRRAVIPNISQ